MFGVACQARPRPTDPQQTLRCARSIRDRPRPLSLKMTVVRGRWLAVLGLMIGAADRREHSRERWSDDHHTQQPATSRVRSRTSSAAFRTPSRPPSRVPHTLRQLHDFTVPRRCRGVSGISPQRDPLRRGAESQDGCSSTAITASWFKAMMTAPRAEMARTGAKAASTRRIVRDIVRKASATFL
jgi:hypothetical protein